MIACPLYRISIFPKCSTPFSSQRPEYSVVLLTDGVTARERHTPPFPACVVKILSSNLTSFFLDSPQNRTEGERYLLPSGSVQQNSLANRECLLQTVP
jgi:hypothetical protein